MSKTEGYRQALCTAKNWDPFLLENSGLPGPRGNLELAHVVAQQGNRDPFNHFLTYHAEENAPDVFIVFCGVLGLGRLAAAQPKIFNRLREYASDPRWRIREACRGRRACRTSSPEAAKACQTGSATIGQITLI